MSGGASELLAPTTLGGLGLRNRVLKAATFEGRCPNGSPSPDLIDFHRAIAKGGTAMTTLAYCAVEPNGRVMDQMMSISDDTAPFLRELADAVHAEGAALSGQMSHCGNFSQNGKFIGKWRGKVPKGPSRAFNMSGIPALLPYAGAMNAADMQALVDHYANAARIMKTSGFDALEIHFGHGYGLSQFISPRTNKRTDDYGGTLINRMRLPLRVLEAVRAVVGDDFPLLGKTNQTDGVRGGLELGEAVHVAAMLDEAGIDAVIPSGGTSSFNPMLLFRGDSLADGLAEYETNPVMRMAIKAVGKKMFRHYPYEEQYFRDGALRIQDHLKRAKLCYIGGVSTRESLEQVLADFDFVQLGRALIRDPNMVNNLAAKLGYKNGCTHCNKCAAMIKAPGGVRCVLNDQPA